jgi:hypothetical protein
VRSLSPNQNIPKSDRTSLNKTSQKRSPSFIPQRSHPTKTPQKAIALSHPIAIALHYSRHQKGDRAWEKEVKSHFFFP